MAGVPKVTRGALAARRRRGATWSGVYNGTMSAVSNSPDTTDTPEATDATAGSLSRRPSARRPGRPRSERAHQAILAATLELLAKVGYQGMSLEGVAARAGVGKTTIYRRWPSKEELAIEALASLDSPTEVRETGDLRADLVATLRREMDPARQPTAVPLMMRLLGEVMENPELFHVYRERVVAPQMALLTEAIERAKARGELRNDVDPALLLELLGGPILLHFIVTGELPPLDEFAERIVDAVWRGVAPDSTGDKPAAKG